MKIGDYVRTYSGDIGILINCPEQLKNEYGNMLWLETMDEQRPLSKKEIELSSPNIIDLIEVGDYVNGLPVERIEGTLDDENDIRLWFGVATYGRTTLNQINHRYTVKDEFEDDYSLRFRCIKPEDIKSIVTKEQFEEMEYKL